jgi:hypothetical protein
VMNSAQTPLRTGSGKVALCRLAQPFFECAQAPPLQREPACRMQVNRLGILRMRARVLDHVLDVVDPVQARHDGLDHPVNSLLA